MHELRKQVHPTQLPRSKSFDLGYEERKAKRYDWAARIGEGAHTDMTVLEPGWKNKGLTSGLFVATTLGSQSHTPDIRKPRQRSDRMPFAERDADCTEFWRYEEKRGL